MLVALGPHEQGIPEGTLGLLAHADRRWHVHGRKRAGGGRKVGLHPALRGNAGEGRHKAIQVAGVGIDGFGTPGELAQAEDEGPRLRDGGHMRVQVPPDALVLALVLHARPPASAPVLPLGSVSRRLRPVAMLRWTCSL